MPVRMVKDEDPIDPQDNNSNSTLDNFDTNNSSNNSDYNNRNTTFNNSSGGSSFGKYLIIGEILIFVFRIAMRIFRRR
jgi:hypothetical protein